MLVLLKGPSGGAGGVGMPGPALGSAGWGVVGCDVVAWALALPFAPASALTCPPIPTGPACTCFCPGAAGAVGIAVDVVPELPPDAEPPAFCPKTLVVMMHAEVSANAKVIFMCTLQISSGTPAKVSYKQSIQESSRGNGVMSSILPLP
jgi:hypothetical protein